MRLLSNSTESISSLGSIVAPKTNTAIMIVFYSIYAAIPTYLLKWLPTTSKLLKIISTNSNQLKGWLMFYGKSIISQVRYER
jgi:hypothetical protein